MRRSAQSIAVWFWSRDDPSVPKDIRLGTTYLDETGWGIPSAIFPASEDCVIEGPGAVFGQHKIILNLT